MAPTMLIPTAGKSLYFVVLKYAFESKVILSFNILSLPLVFKVKFL